MYLWNSVAKKETKSILWETIACHIESESGFVCFKHSFTMSGTPLKNERFKHFTDRFGLYFVINNLKQLTAPW